MSIVSSCTVTLPFQLFICLTARVWQHARVLHQRRAELRNTGKRREELRHGALARSQSFDMLQLRFACLLGEYVNHVRAP